VLDRQALRYTQVECQSEVQLLAQELRDLHEQEQWSSGEHVDLAYLIAPSSFGLEQADQLSERILLRSEQAGFNGHALLAQLRQLRAGFLALQQRGLKASLLLQPEGLSGIELDSQVGLDAHANSLETETLLSLPELEFASDQLRYEIQSEFHRLKSENEIEEEFPIRD